MGTVIFLAGVLIAIAGLFTARRSTANRLIAARPSAAPAQPEDVHEPEHRVPLPFRAAMTLRNFKLVALIEATTFLLLLVASYVKRANDQPLGVEILGPIHGLLFIAYVVMALAVRESAGWSGKQTLLILLGAVSPSAATSSTAGSTTTTPTSSAPREPGAPRRLPAMGFLSRWRRALTSRRADGVAKSSRRPRFDDWEVVREFEDLDTARAWHQQLRDAGIEAVLTADHEPDRFGRGDIYLQVPPGRWSEAEELLGVRGGSAASDQDLRQ